jgi:Ca2+/Na+ antiporter
MEQRLDCRKILAFSAVVEVATGAVLMVDPVIVARLLLGAELTGVGIAVGRCFGIALVALALACWPSPQRMESSGPAVRGMLTYNALIALFLVYLIVVNHVGGALLWPGAALHAAVALLLVLTLRGERHAKAIEQ